jgi:VanZ family protein
VPSKRRRRSLKPTSRELTANWWPVAVWLVVIRLESTDYASSTTTFGLLYNIAVSIFGHIDPNVLLALNSILRKSGHFLGYAILSWLVFRALKLTQRGRLRLVLQRRWGIFFRDLWQREWAMIAILFTVVTASFDELHQVTLSSRSGRWQDVVIDTAGALLMQCVLYARAAHEMHLQQERSARRHRAPRLG